jgi:hypothetical protein
VARLPMPVDQVHGAVVVQIGTRPTPPNQALQNSGLAAELRNRHRFPANNCGGSA